MDIAQAFDMVMALWGGLVLMFVAAGMFDKVVSLEVVDDDFKTGSDYLDRRFRSDA